MKNFNTRVKLKTFISRNHWRSVGWIVLVALLSVVTLNAQSGCGQLTPTFESTFEPCKFRLKFDCSNECYQAPVTVFINPGAFASWSANTGAGWTGVQLAPNMVQLTHNQGFIPLGLSFPMLFTLPPGLVTEANLSWEFNCPPGEGCTLFPGITLTSCPDQIDGSIIGTKYRECGNLPFSNQPAVADWPIQLLDTMGNLITEDFTDAGGNYGFYNLPFGNYVVKEGVKPGWTANVPASGQYALHLDASQQVIRNFGNCPALSSIQGVAYRECNHQLYSTQQTLPGRTIQLLDQNFNLITTTVTDAAGAYSFTGLVPGNYFVKIVAQPGWTANQPGSGQFSVSLSGSPQVLNFGACPASGSVTGVKYIECTKSAYTNQTTVPGWPIQLLDQNGQLIAETVTDGNGAYQFFDLPYGIYIVRESLSPDWEPNIPESGEMQVELSPLQSFQVVNFGNCYIKCNPCPGNLVPNPSFELGAAGFPNGLNQIGQCTGWSAASGGAGVGTGDWYSTATPAFPGYYLNPQQTVLQPHSSCDNYAGFYLNSCDGISTQLSSVITQGCSYQVEFWWALAATPTTPFSFNAVMSGAPCTMHNNGASCSHTCGGDQHVIVSVLPGTHVAGVWYKHTATVSTAYPNVQNLTFTAVQGQPFPNNYVFVDDVCVKKSEAPCQVDASIICYPQNPTAYTAQANLGCGGQVTNVCWYFDGVGPSNCSGNLTSVLHPFSTPGIHNVCLVVTASSDGGHTFCKDSVCKEVFIAPPQLQKCDSISMQWQPYHGPNPPCCYWLAVDNIAPNCFYALEMTLSSGTFANAVIATGWSVLGGNLNSNHIILFQSNLGFIPTGQFSPLFLCVPGGTAPTTLQVSAWYGLPPNIQKCEKSFQFECSEAIEPCCADSSTFNNLMAQGFTITQHGCEVTVTAPQFDSCFFFSTPPVLDNGIVSQVVVPASGSWTFSFSQSGTHQVCVKVFDECNFKEMCTSFTVACEQCNCQQVSFGFTHNGVFQPVSCDNPAQNPTYGCPVSDVTLSGALGCVQPDGTQCGQSVISWNLYGPNGFIAQGTTPGPALNINFPAANISTPGAYTVSLQTLCPGQTDSCYCKLYWVQEACDTCCKDYDTFLALAQNTQLFGTLGDCTLSFQATGLNDCMQIKYDWGDGSAVQGPFSDNTLVSHTYSGTGNYLVCSTIEELNANGQVCWSYERCDSVYVICSSCCTDFDLFSLAVQAATNVIVDDANCKATLAIGDLPICDYIEKIFWGDGSQSFGPFVSGDMPMHTYSGNGTYTISFLAIETNPASGLICFEKLISYTITLQCTIDCPECPNNLVQNPGFSAGAVAGNLDFGGVSNNWSVASGSPQVATTVSCCDPVSMQMWGNQDLGESICQSGFNFQANKTYSISFSARFYQPGLPTPYVRFGFTAANSCLDPFGCSGVCETIGESGQISNQYCTTYTLPNWTPTANWNTLIIRAFNNVPDINDPSTISWGRIDNLCIQEVKDSCVEAPSGLVAWWPMDDALGDSKVVDIVQHLHDGVPKPNGMVGIPDGPEPIAGKVAGALQYISVPGTAYVEVADDPALNFGAGSFSIDAWINTPMGTQTAPIIDKLGNTNNGYAFSIQGTSPYYPTLVIGKGNLVDVFQGPPITLNNWNFVAVTVSPQSVNFYVGDDAGVTFSQPPGQVTGAYNASNTARPLLIGANPLNPHWNITIDELELFNRELSAAELRSIWEAGSFGKCKNLVSVHNPRQPMPLRIYPNPNTGDFQVELPDAASAGMRFRITDLTGRLLLEQAGEPGSTQQSIRAAVLPNGLYFLQVVLDGKVQAVEKFVKQ